MTFSFISLVAVKKAEQ